MRIAGNGIYDIPEAARLLGITSARMYTWFRGWARAGTPLFKPDYEGMVSGTVISFLDLMDATVAITLRHKHDISMQAIRKLRIAFGNKWGSHPFARKEFYTLPDSKSKSIFWRAIQEGRGEEHIVELPAMQLVIPEIMIPILRRVKYNKQTKLAETIALTDRVVLDPRRKYGKPTVVGTGMPTAILNECYQATQSYDVVADWYSVDPEDVQAAVRFENDFSGIAA